MRQVAQRPDGLADAAVELVEQLEVGGRRRGGEAVADEPDTDRERHEVLLRAIVQVALDPLALAVRSGDQSAAGGLQVHVRLSQVGERGLQRLVQAPVAQHDRQPAGDLGQRPVVRSAERQRVRRALDEDQRQDAVALQGRCEP